MANTDILNFLQELQRSFLECGVCAEVCNEDDHKNYLDRITWVNPLLMGEMLRFG
jgi:hypothetical protein